MFKIRYPTPDDTSSPMSPHVIKTVLYSYRGIN